MEILTGLANFGGDQCMNHGLSGFGGQDAAHAIWDDLHLVAHLPDHREDFFADGFPQHEFAFALAHFEFAHIGLAFEQPRIVRGGESQFFQGFIEMPVVDRRPSA